MPQRTASHHPARRLPRTAMVALVAAVVSVSFSGAGGLPRAVLAETPSPTPAATTVSPPPHGDLVTFYGRGYGHGVGMSQYGARGRALAGQDAPTILAHYYQGTTLGLVDPATRIRVLVLSRWVATEAHPLEIAGRVTPWTVDGLAASFPPDARLRLGRSVTSTVGTWWIAVTAADGSPLYDGPAPADIVIRPATDDGRVQVISKATRFNLYRGNLHVVLTPASSRVSVVDDVALDAYLGGVVPVEMPPTWPVAALQAQAIAARSFAARRLHPATSFYDVPDTSASQLFRGVLAEKPQTNAAISATAGQVLMSGSSIINALFDSTGGGATESNENVYTTATGRVVARPVSYLRGSSDRAPDGTPYDATSPYATWATRTYARSQLSAWFASDSRTNVGDLLALDLHDRGVSGRLISVTLIGTAETRRVSGEVFRAVFNEARPSSDPSLRSTLFDLAPIP
ncbi:MAG: SpoIID/LytB domain-containing protein [Candidatus Limnocylindrales bacterium]